MPEYTMFDEALHNAYLDDMKKRLDFAVTRLRAGLSVELTTNMGSCHCGSHSGHVLPRDGVVMAECHGTEEWQRSHGPATECCVAYGWGQTAQAIAIHFAHAGGEYWAKLVAHEPRLLDGFRQGTGFGGETAKAWRAQR